eukprot:Phypoly_transcript_13124.p1 GENE.Phypoly_transcript_13124~~Phypoly_transcript_13124.p1  ORF type:complete len:331 (+),score=52.59 Phypoly_transcript_13124:66-1058(+)
MHPFFVHIYTSILLIYKSLDEYFARIFEFFWSVGLGEYLNLLLRDISSALPYVSGFCNRIVWTLSYLFKVVRNKTLQLATARPTPSPQYQSTCEVKFHLVREVIPDQTFYTTQREPVPAEREEQDPDLQAMLDRQVKELGKVHRRRATQPRPDLFPTYLRAFGNPDKFKHLSFYEERQVSPVNVANDALPDFYLSQSTPPASPNSFTSSESPISSQSPVFGNRTPSPSTSRSSSTITYPPPSRSSSASSRPPSTITSSSRPSSASSRPSSITFPPPSPASVSFPLSRPSSFPLPSRTAFTFPPTSPSPIVPRSAPSPYSPRVPGSPMDFD